MNNSVFGKILENIWNRVDIRLLTSDKKVQKLAANPNYDHCTIFDENLIAVHMKKTKLYFNKPIYLGMSILDLSKSLMYDFHYNYIKTKYGDKVKLLFTTPTLSHMKLRPKIFTKISIPTLRNDLTIVTTKLIIHLVSTLVRLQLSSQFVCSIQTCLQHCSPFDCNLQASLSAT